MLNIIKKEECCGCYACYSVCPNNSITMKDDNEGFIYPKVNKNTCIDCRLCEKVCPVLNQNKTPDYKTYKAFAAKNKNTNIRKESSSGGIFSLLAEETLKRGGIIFGAVYNKNWDVIHTYTEQKENIKLFRGSKYVQSRINESYRITKEFLIKGKEVLFTGTPCQINGLKLFLRKDYPNLYTVDFICHGVPSPKVYNLYINEILEKKGYTKKNLSSINFRDKTKGWKKYSFLLKLKDGNLIRILNNKDLFLKAFSRNLFLRPSCHNCPSKALKSTADITIADYWGIEFENPKFYDKNGVSLVITGTEKGINKLNQLDYTGLQTSFKNLLNNGSLMRSAIKHPNRNLFFNTLKNTKQNNISKIIYKYTKLTKKERMSIYLNHQKGKLKLITIRLGILNILKRILKPTT